MQGLFVTIDAHFGQRLREERERCEFTQKQVADMVGVRREMWARYETGVEPGAGLMSAAADAGIDVLYVLTGERRTPTLKSGTESADGSISGRVTPQRGGAEAPGVGGSQITAPSVIDPISWHANAATPLVLPVLFEASNIRREFQVIPKLKAEASAGPGLGNASEATLEPAGIMALDKGWMFDNLGRSGDGFASVQVHGDSMEPTLWNGDTIVIDTRVDRIDVSGIYVVKAGANVLVKRIQLKFDGTLVLKSDNAAYEPETLSTADAVAMKVQGRMVWPRVR